MTSHISVNDLKWWQKAVFYQIYPRSFADGNGDGIGDFKGMIERLDYLQELGIDAVWLSPHYPSPQHDCGYDISDYTGVAPEYGTLDDFKRFLEEAHRRDIRVILDLVLNHTSDQHSWFIESRSSRDNPRRHWYVWRDGKGPDGPPNNWYSFFGGSAWEYDPVTGQYYYHAFLKEQPDLNWRNPQVKQAMWEAVRFWLDLGVDGFRLDAIGTIFEHPDLPDHTAKSSLEELHYRAYLAADEQEAARAREEIKELFRYQIDLPEVHALMKELRAVVDAYPDRMLVGESEEIAYYGSGNDELHLVFNFPLMRTNRLTPAWVRANQRTRLAELPPGAWPCNTLGNHDTSRVYSQFGDGKHDAALARISLALVLTLRGTPFLYNGEEIGMTDLLLDDISQFRDTVGIRAYKMITELLGLGPAEAVQLAARVSRDRCRTPMQWANAPNAGFSPAGVRTWLPVNPNYAQGVNVAEQLDDPDSLLHFYRRMLHMRRRTPALIAGDYTPLHEDAEDYLAFLRTSQADRQCCLVVLNMSERAHTLRFALGAPTARLIFSSHKREEETDQLSHLKVAPFEVYVGEVGE
ncbi:MAG: alpha-glucosidase [Anaerolineae bacterium]|nr:alpha-glucosidase [Anaerolineae bacterium]